MTAAMKRDGVNVDNNLTLLVLLKATGQPAAPVYTHRSMTFKSSCKTQKDSFKYDYLFRVTGDKIHVSVFIRLHLDKIML